MLIKKVLRIQLLNPRLTHGVNRTGEEVGAEAVVDVDDGDAGSVTVEQEEDQSHGLMLMFTAKCEKEHDKQCLV